MERRTGASPPSKEQGRRRAESSGRDNTKTTELLIGYNTSKNSAVTISVMVSMASFLCQSVYLDDNNNIELLVG